MNWHANAGWCFVVAAALVWGAGCATTGKAGDGIIMIGEDGKDKPVTPAEVDAMSGIDRPYYLQVGDVVDVDFQLRGLRDGEPAWDYRIEVGDSMEVRFSPDTSDPGAYRLEQGDVIGISFLDNWQLNVTRTVRTDGMITAPEVGDVLAEGMTAHQLRDKLKAMYVQSGIIEGEPRITVNVDFVNLDRYGDISRDVVVRPDGAIRLPRIEEDIRIAGLTVAEATEQVKEASRPVLVNPPKVALIIFPAVDTNILDDLSGPQQVGPDGRISVPQLGEFQAAGYSLNELSHMLVNATQGLVHNPVEPALSLLKSTGGRIYVGGQVKNPGVYPLEGAPSALQAVITANGFNDNSRLNNVIIMRRNPQGKPYVFNTNLRVAITRGHTENDIRLCPFDIVYVPKKTISKLNLFVEQYIDKMVPFDNSLGVNLQYYMNTQEVDSTSKSLNFNTGVTGITDVLNP